MRRQHAISTRSAPIVATVMFAAAGVLMTTASASAAEAPEHLSTIGDYAATAPHIEAPTVTLTPPAPPLPESVTRGDIPETNFAAYRDAAETISHTAPACGVTWQVIAGIGKVESHHADSGNVDANGQLRKPILGPVLDGSLAGNRVISDTDGGRLDGNATYDRAVGPMQFLPSTWETYGADGNGDGIRDPQNIFDAALATANYLCAEETDLHTAAGRQTAILRYNNSTAYVSKVLGFAETY